MTDFRKEARSLECTKETKTGLFKVRMEGSGDAWLDTRNGLEFYVYGEEGLKHDVSPPSEVKRLFKLKQGEKEASLNSFVGGKE